jgi:hypothetical protein
VIRITKITGSYAVAEVVSNGSVLHDKLTIRSPWK